MAIVFVECGLFFPFLPGDTLLFALGLFIAGGKYHVLGVDNKAVGLLIAMRCSRRGVPRNVVGYEIGRGIGPPLYQRDGRIIKRKHLDKTERVLREARQQGAGDRPVRAVRADLHHRRGGRDPDGAAPVLLLERGRRGDVGRQHHDARLLPRRELPGARREHRLRRPRDPRVLDDPDHLRVVQAPPQRAPRSRRGRGAGTPADPQPDAAGATSEPQPPTEPPRAPRPGRPWSAPAAPRGRRRRAGSRPPGSGRSRRPRPTMAPARAARSSRPARPRRW